MTISKHIHIGPNFSLKRAVKTVLFSWFIITALLVGFSGPRSCLNSNEPRRYVTSNVEGPRCYRLREDNTWYHFNPVAKDGLDVTLGRALGFILK